MRDVGGVGPDNEVWRGVDGDDIVGGEGDDHYPRRGWDVPEDLGVAKLG